MGDEAGDDMTAAEDDDDLVGSGSARLCTEDVSLEMLSVDWKTMLLLL